MMNRLSWSHTTKSMKSSLSGCEPKLVGTSFHTLPLSFLAFSPLLSLIVTFLSGDCHLLLLITELITDRQSWHLSPLYSGPEPQPPLPFLYVAILSGDHHKLSGDHWSSFPAENIPELSRAREFESISNSNCLHRLHTFTTSYNSFR